MRSFLIAGLLFLVGAASNAGACSSPDQGFRQFFERFGDDGTFQRQRMAPAVRMGYIKEVSGKEQRIWRELSPDRIIKIFGGGVLPKADERHRGYETRYGSASGTTAAVRVLKKESDAFVVTLFFQKAEGCWQLYGIQDDSNLEWKL